MREKEARHLEACPSLSNTMAHVPSIERTVNDRSSMLCITKIHSMMKKILLTLKFIVKFFTFIDHKIKINDDMSSSGKLKTEAVKILRLMWSLTLTNGRSHFLPTFHGCRRGLPGIFLTLNLHKN